MSSLLHLPLHNHNCRVTRVPCSSRFLIPAVPILLIAALAASNVYYFTFPSQQHAPFPLLNSSRSNRSDAPCDIFTGEWVVGTRPRRALLHQRDLFGDPRALRLHEVRQARPRLHQVAVAPRRLRPAVPRPGALPRRDEGKSMAFVGDSLARNHMQSLICLLSRVEKPTPNSPSDTGVYRFEKHNFIVGNFWAPFLVRHEMIEDDGPAHTVLWNLYLDEPDTVWASSVPAFDYVVVSASNWFYRPAMLYQAGGLVGCYYCLRPNVTDLTLNNALRMATRTTLRFLAGAADDGGFRGTAVLHTVSPSQYENGAWNKDGDCVRTRPYQRGEKRVEGFELDFHKLQLEEFVAAKEAARVAGGVVRMMLMDTTEAMVMRTDAHPSKYRGYTPEKHFHKYKDCVHWCLPGAIDAWNDMMLHMLTSDETVGR